MKCSMCRNYKVTGSVVRLKQDIDKGECRKHTPVVIKDVSFDSEWGLWPIVWEDDWCGEFDIKIEKEKL